MAATLLARTECARGSLAPNVKACDTQPSLRAYGCAAGGGGAVPPRTGKRTRPSPTPPQKVAKTHIDLIRVGSIYLRYYFVLGANLLRQHNLEYKGHYWREYRDVSRYQHKRALPDGSQGRASVTCSAHEE